MDRAVRCGGVVVFRDPLKCTSSDPALLMFSLENMATAVLKVLYIE